MKYLFKVWPTEINFSFQKAFLPKENHILYTSRVIGYRAFQSDNAHLRTPPMCNQPLFFVTHPENIPFSWLRFCHMLEFTRSICRKVFLLSIPVTGESGYIQMVVSRIMGPHRHLGQKKLLEVIKSQQSLQLNYSRH